MCVGSIVHLRYCLSHIVLLQLRLRLAFSVVVYACTTGILTVDVAREAGEKDSGVQRCRRNGHLPDRVELHITNSSCTSLAYILAQSFKRS